MNRTARQIDSTYDGLIVVHRSNGKETHRCESQDPFKKVKQSAIDDLKRTIDNHFGRGNHTVTIFGAKYVDKQDPAKYAVGFPSQWELEPIDELFTL